MASPLTAAVVSALLLAAALGAAFPRGHVHRTLYDQRLSHLAFHSGDLKPALARLVSDPATSAASVAVVGVEWGAEVVALAEIGFHVYAFEPVAKFVAHLEEVLKEKPHLNVTVLPIAAVAERNVGNVTLEYPNAGVSESVASGIVDDFVKGELAVLSIDVQGNELEVLQGAKHLLSGVKPAVRSMWLEAFSCHMGAYEMLHLIDEAYVIFDFVPWGMSRKDPKVKVPRSSRSFADDGRPDKFRKHWQWMCDVGRERFRWLQTDFVAIRRDLITDELVAKMGRLAEEVCGPGEGKANCMLRDARAGGVDGEREEL